jgi:hypothetical protein
MPRTIMVQSRTLEENLVPHLRVANDRQDKNLPAFSNWKSSFARSGTLLEAAHGPPCRRPARIPIEPEQN